MEIYKQLGAIFAEIPAVGKNQTVSGTGGGYKARSFEEMANAMSKIFAKHGVVVTVSAIENLDRKGIVSKSGSSGTNTSALWTFCFVSTIDGSAVTSMAIGEADDYGDKSAGKAQTYALKKCLEAVFLLPTKDDPDKANQQRSAATQVVKQLEFKDLNEVSDDWKAVIESATTEAELTKVFAQNKDVLNDPKNRLILDAMRARVKELK